MLAVKPANNMNSTLATFLASNQLQPMLPDIQNTSAFLNYSPIHNIALTTSAPLAIQFNHLPQYGAKSHMLKHRNHNEQLSDPDSMMISKSDEGYYVFNNITLKVRLKSSFITVERRTTNESECFINAN